MNIFRYHRNRDRLFVSESAKVKKEKLKEGKYNADTTAPELANQISRIKSSSTYSLSSLSVELLTKKASRAALKLDLLR